MIYQIYRWFTSNSQMMIYIDLPIKDGGFHWFPRATFNNQSALKCVFPGDPDVKNSRVLDHGDSRPKILI